MRWNPRSAILALNKKFPSVAGVPAMKTVQADAFEWIEKKAGGENLT